MFHRPESESEQLVGIDREITWLEWIMIVTGPFLMPLFAPFILIYGVKVYLSKKSGKRDDAMRHKAMLVGLGQWAYRVFCWLACIAVLIFLLIKFKRFG